MEARKRKRNDSGNKNQENDASDYDMFASTSSEMSNVDKNADPVIENKKNTNARRLNALENDDADGYYLLKNGEAIGAKSQYKVLGNLGRGVFSTVVICDVVDCGEFKKVAIKMIRNNASMTRAGQKEINMLEKIGNIKSKNTYIVRLLDHFEHRNHLCLVFEPLKHNLREVLHQYGRNIGLNLGAVKIYAKQLFTALKRLSSLNIVHADFKLDNILVSEKMGLLKLCDFGSAFFEDDPSLEPTPYLVSRYYRAPEIILGLKYTKKVDVWALACCIFELFTGKILFPGGTNNEMLLLFQRAKGRFTVKMIKKHLTSYLIMHKLPHFEPQSMKFVEFSQDSERLLTKQVTILDKPEESITQKLLNDVVAKGEDDRDVKLLANLLDQCLALDPQKRSSPEQCLKHKFLESSDK